ncbi:MAG: amidohydrolase family protein, partial [Clostridia bacterium]|nr:amidohydrolase family protein [Clostridia bacterium]
DKILYATDTPWSNMKASIAFWLALDIDDGIRRQILSGNAKRLLGL